MSITDCFVAFITALVVYAHRQTDRQTMYLRSCACGLIVVCKKYCVEATLVSPVFLKSYGSPMIIFVFILFM